VKGELVDGWSKHTVMPGYTRFSPYFTRNRRPGTRPELDVTESTEVQDTRSSLFAVDRRNAIVIFLYSSPNNHVVLTGDLFAGI